MQERLTGIALLSTLALATSASAAVVSFYTDRSLFEADAPVTMVLEDFEDAKDPFAQIFTEQGATQEAVNAANENAAFAAGAIIPNINFWLTASSAGTGIGWYVMTSDSNTYMMTSDYGLRIEFDQPIAWFGMNIVDASSSGDIVVKNGDTTLGYQLLESGFHRVSFGLACYQP